MKALEILHIILKIIEVVALLALSAFLLQMRQTVKQVGDQAQQTLIQIHRSSKDLSKDVKDLKEMTNATLFQVGDASHEVAQAAREQRIYWKKDGEQTVKILGHVDQLISSLNQDETKISNSTVVALTEVTTTLQTSQATLKASTETIQQTNKILSDPNIQQTLDHVNSTMANIQHTSQSIDQAIARMTKPKSLLKSIFSSLLDLAAKFSAILK
jgi:paraquat-inducible protein B